MHYYNTSYAYTTHITSNVLSYSIVAKIKEGELSSHTLLAFGFKKPFLLPHISSIEELSWKE